MTQHLIWVFLYVPQTSNMEQKKKNHKMKMALFVLDDQVIKRRVAMLSQEVVNVYLLVNTP